MLQVTSLSQSSFLEKHEQGYKWNSFCVNAYFCQKGGGTLGIHALLGCVYVFLCNYSFLVRNVEYTKAVIYTVVKVGGDTGQGPATEVTHIRLNQPPVFSSGALAYISHKIAAFPVFACKTGGGKCLGKRLGFQIYLSFHEGLGMCFVLAALYTLSVVVVKWHAAGNKISSIWRPGELQVKNVILVQTGISPLSLH